MAKYTLNFILPRRANFKRSQGRAQTPPHHHACDAKDRSGRAKRGAVGYFRRSGRSRQQPDLRRVLGRIYGDFGRGRALRKHD